MNRIKMNEIIKTFGVFLAVAILAIGLVLPQSVSAALPAPRWLPGQPLLAGSQVIAMWLPVPGAVKYVLYLNGEKIAESPANQYMGLAPADGGQYKYEVAAIDASGAEGPRSAPGAITITLIVPPTELVSRANRQGRFVNLRWKNPAGAAIINVYKSESADGPFNLIASITGEGHKDSDLEYGKNYYYALSSKDVTGKESSRSNPLQVTIAEPEQAKVKIKLNLTAVPSKEVDRLRFVGNYTISEISNMVQVPSGNFWLATGRDGRVVEVGPDMEPIQTIDVKKILKAAGHNWVSSYRIAVQEDFRFTVTDNQSSMVASFTTDGELLWIIDSLPAPPLDRDDIWSGVRKDLGDLRRIPGQPMYLDDDTLWVTEGTGPMVYVIDPEEGEVFDYWTGYTMEDGTRLPSAGIGNLFKVSDDLVWAGESLVHRAVAFNPNDRVVKYIAGKESDGFIGGFLGVNALTFTPDGNILVGDAGVGTLQVFNPKDGTYLYHIGDEKLVADEKLDRQRPVLPLGGFTGLFFDPKGNLMAMDGITKIISVREVNWQAKEVIGD